MSLRKIAMSKKTKMLQDLFHDTLKDVYFAEKKILTTLPKMKKAAESEELAAAFEKHHGETEGHVQRLEQVFKIIGEKPQAKTWELSMKAPRSWRSIKARPRWMRGC
jgi:ferritin-like metal-binding protein YciE